MTGGTTGTTTLLATIQSIDPIRFEFTMDETSYLRYLRTRQDRARSCKPRRQCAREAQAARREGVRAPGAHGFRRQRHRPFLRHHPRTRASSPIPDGTFTPGMFGRIQVASGPPGEALLVPDVAIGTEQVRKFVLVVDDQNVARAKYVTLGPVVDGLRVVATGPGGGRPRGRQRPDARAAGREGHAAAVDGLRCPGAGRAGTIELIRRATRCASRTSSSTGRFSRRSSPSCS